jgi:divalent metal cation (Fe/Co/Zn/Cd) transporter
LAFFKVEGMWTFLFTATERKNASIISTIAVPRSTIEKRMLWLQLVTLSWMLVECSIALTAAWKARSVSLLAFGSDSIVELISAAVVLLQFTPRFRISQVRAARFCGILLYGLAGVVSVIALAALFDHMETETSALGMTITGGALLFMPVLARMKRNTAEKTGNKALRADAVQSATCAYLAALSLGGLLLRWAFGLYWLDQISALAAVPILILEAKRARKGETCACC